MTQRLIVIGAGMATGRMLEHLFDAVIFPQANPQERVVNARGLAGDAESFEAWCRLWLQNVEGGIDPQFLIFESLSKLDVGD